MTHNAEYGTHLTPPSNSDEHAGELAQRLRQKKQQLEERETEFRIQVWAWESNTSAQQKKIRQRERRVEQKEIELRKLQFQLFELQNQIIQSQLALQQASHLISPSVPQPSADTESGLELLRFELDDRYAVVEASWMQIMAEMSRLANQIATDVQQKA